MLSLIKKYKKSIIITIIILISISLFSYKYIIPKNEERIKIETLSDIELYRFNSFTKFNNEKIGIITDENKLIKFKTLFNSLNKSYEIKKVPLPDNINLKSFQYFAHIKPNFKYIKDNMQMEDAYFLLYMLVNNSEGKSYIIFEPSLTYVLDKNETNILKEIFINTKVN